MRVYGVPGGTGYIRDNIALFTQQCIGEARLAHVGLPENGQVRNFAGLFVTFFYMLYDGIQQFACTTASYRGEEKSIFEAQRPEFIGFQLSLRIVDFIDD